MLSEENEKLIGYMKKLGYLKSKNLEDALRAVPRELFIPKGLKELAYVDSPLSIGHGQTISQPSTVVLMTEMLRLRKGQKVLEIGSGSGWQAALIANIVKEKVYTVEKVFELVYLAKKNLRQARIKNVVVIHGDGSHGLKQHAPYDKIIVTAAMPTVAEPLLEQLKVGGRLVGPVGNVYMQKMVIVDKTGKNSFHQKELEGWFAFVPLLGTYGFK